LREDKTRQKVKGKRQKIISLIPELLNWYRRDISRF
jgi:hypothetical protein